MGITLADLEVLSIGMVFDMIAEHQNDSYEYKELATQDDFDKF